MKLLVSYLVANLLVIQIIAADFLKISKVFNQNESKIDASCMNDLVKLNSSILKTWSTFTSSHKYGNSHDFGDFFGCNSINNTQYCLVQYFQASNPPISVLPSTSYYQKLWTDLDVSFLGAVCLPSSCDLQDVREIFENFNEDRNLTFSDKIFCKTRKSEKFGIKLNKNNFSILNWWSHKRIGILTLLIMQAIIFSMPGITKLDTKNIIKDLVNSNSSNDSTGYMNGIKAISTIIIIIGHSYCSRIVMLFKSGKNHEEFDKKWLYQPLGMTGLMMESFFIIGGILTARSLKKGMNGSNKLVWIVKFYIKRFMRLVPVTIFYIILLTSSDSDTMAPYNVGMNEETRRYIWFMPFIYNFLPLKITYSSMIWFVSVYLQFNIVAPFVLLLTRMKRCGHEISIILMIGLIIARFVHASSGLVEIVLSSSNAGLYTTDSMNVHYTSGKYRLLPFFGGLMLEKFLTQKLTKPINLMQLAFFVAITVVGIVIEIKPFVNHLQLLAAGESIIMILIFLIFYLIHHNDWTIKKFLSHKFWDPISKMGLTIYLITSYFLFTIHEREVEPIEIKNELEFLMIFITDVLKTAVPILVTFVFVEEPWSRLGDYFANSLFKKLIK